MGESLFVFRLLVSFFLALDCSTRVLGGVEDLERKLLGHAFPATLARETHDPTSGEGPPALPADLHGGLGAGAAGPARVHLVPRGVDAGWTLVRFAPPP